MRIGSQDVAARFWYDGRFVNMAKEDAAREALELMGLRIIWRTSAQIATARKNQLESW